MGIYVDYDNTAGKREQNPLFFSIYDPYFYDTVNER